MSIVMVTGGFDPIHSGHIAYFKEAKKLGTRLIVGLNSDEWLERKKGKAFMPWNERLKIVSNLQMVDEVFTFMDDDGSAINFIKQVKAHYPNKHLIFANGGDRTSENIPEMVFDDVEFVFSVGGDDKKNSSSWILTEWKTPKTNRVWGYYRDLHSDGPGVKVKELTVNPRSKLSMQMHNDRSEHWHISYGTATVNTSIDNPEEYSTMELTKDETINIPVGTWHQLCNNTDDEVRVVEIQYGKNCVEEDIIRHGVDPYYGK